ncbi:MAG: 3-deoxy-7-phosphoheptulonate synthase [Gammaproteobacteria bacterium]|jgi:3-deoxy-7-phosphoheptulonate synthase
MLATDNLNIDSLQPLSTPAEIYAEFPITEKVAAICASARQDIAAALHGTDDRLVVVVGPCSIHDPVAAIDYAARLAGIRKELHSELQIVMRVYFEKPRTTVGWKGLINDPNLDNSFEINKGLRVARKLLLDINEMGIPAGTEFLDLISPQYVADLVAWGAIGARTTESQSHRELASGLSCPIGFKNGTGGDVKIAIDAIGAAIRPHHFLGSTKEGNSAIVATKGNAHCHVILRGGKTPNYDPASVASTNKKLEEAKLDPRLMIDFSHANSNKQHERQMIVGSDIAGRIAAGDRSVFGVMIESNITAGRQNAEDINDLTYGQSITDACIGWDDTTTLLRELAAAVKTRRINS